MAEKVDNTPELSELKKLQDQRGELLDEGRGGVIGAGWKIPIGTFLLIGLLVSQGPKDANNITPEEALRIGTAFWELMLGVGGIVWGALDLGEIIHKFKSADYIQQEILTLRSSLNRNNPES